jgi:hypothetical protein
MTAPRKRVTPPKPKPRLSVPSLNLFASLVSQVTLSATSDDFLAQAKVLDTARSELLAALDEADEPTPTP